MKEKITEEATRCCHYRFFHHALQSTHAWQHLVVTLYNKLYHMQSHLQIAKLLAIYSLTHKKKTDDPYSQAMTLNTPGDS